MSRPVLEIVIRAVVVADQKRMSAVTELPIKAGMHSAERTKGKGVPCFLGGFRDDFGIRD